MHVQTLKASGGGEREGTETNINDKFKIASVQNVIYDDEER